MTKYISTYTGAQVDEAIGWIRDIIDNGIVTINDNWRMRADGNVLYTEYSTDDFVTISYTDSKVAE
jgi:hypothetical protein